MIIGENRDAVICNIRDAAQKGNLNDKVEINDPVLTGEQSAEIINGYLRQRGTVKFKAKSFVARRTVNTVTRLLNCETEIVGIENAECVKGGAIITSNHFSPVDNTVIRYLARKLGKRRINIVSQETNLAMTGVVGFLMNYADVIPINSDPHYLHRELTDIIEELLKKDEYILIYPEREMWFNYRKPRPLLRGAYYYAARLSAPVISCFVEMRDLIEPDNNGEFHKVKYTVHILPPIYPNPQKSVRENSIEMCKRDYEQKKAAYEAAYGKPLCYEFEDSDIAGWQGEAANE